MRQQPSPHELDDLMDLSQPAEVMSEDEEEALITLKSFSESVVLTLSEKNILRARLLVGLPREDEEDIPSLAARLHAAQRTPDEWSPLPCVWDEPTLQALSKPAFKALCDEHRLPRRHSSIRMMLRWASIVCALNAEFSTALRLTEELVGVFRQEEEEAYHQLFRRLLSDLEEGGCWTAADLIGEFPEGAGREILSRVLEKSRSRWEHLELAAHAASEGECDAQLDEWRREHMRVVEVLHPVNVATTPAPTPKKRKSSQRRVKKSPSAAASTTHSARSSTSRQKRSKTDERTTNTTSREERSPTPEEEEKGELDSGGGGKDEEEDEDGAHHALAETLQRIAQSGAEVQEFLQRHWDEGDGMISLSLAEPTPNVAMEDAVERLQRESLPNGERERDADGWTPDDARLYRALKQWWALVACAHATRVLLEDVKRRKRGKTKVQTAWKARVRVQNLDRQRFDYVQARRYAVLSEFLQQHPEYLRQVAVCSLKAWVVADGGLYKLLSASGEGVEKMDVEHEDGEDGEEEEDDEEEDTEEAPEGEWPRPDMPEADDLRVDNAAAGSVRGVCGLVNLENTCYMNSLVQALLNCAPLRAELLRNAPPVTIEQCQTLSDEVAQVSLPNALQMLAGVMWSGQYTRVAPVRMQDAVWKHVPAFQCYQEQDAQELMMRLLPSLHRHQRAVFKGRARYDYSCDACGGSFSSGLEIFSQLTFPPPVESRAHHNRKKPTAECSLQDCLRPLFAPADLDEFRCPLDGCGESGQITRVYRVVEAPQVLCLNLKRFCEPSESSGRRAKNDAAVHFPLEGLELGSSSYRLRATVRHHGTAMGKGHYSCYAFNDEAGAWSHFNDEVVCQVEPREMLEAEAYMLFYELE